MQHILRRHVVLERPAHQLVGMQAQDLAQGRVGHLHLSVAHQRHALAQQIHKTAVLRFFPAGTPAGATGRLREHHKNVSVALVASADQYLQPLAGVLA